MLWFFREEAQNSFFGFILTEAAVALAVPEVRRVAPAVRLSREDIREPRPAIWARDLRFTPATF
jgi:hypothetical protein